MPRVAARLTHVDRVLELLRHQSRPLSAYEILEALRNDGVTAATTVYRALDKLLETNRVHRIESLNAWTACCEPDHSEIPVFEICDGCGSVTEHIAPHFARDIVALSANSGFVPDRLVIEVHGHCSDCSANLPSACKN